MQKKITIKKLNLTNKNNLFGFNVRFRYQNTISVSLSLVGCWRQQSRSSQTFLHLWFHTMWFEIGSLRRSEFGWIPQCLSKNKRSTTNCGASVFNCILVAKSTRKFIWPNKICSRDNRNKLYISIIYNEN